MGSTLESAICFSLIILLLAVFISAPALIWKDSLDRGNNGVSEMRYHMKNEHLIYEYELDGYDTCDTSPELLNTMLNGIIDTIKIAGR
ncbi:MAG: hypothetical protein J6U54_04725 [Clostridiales bacterium]|nr:hypothetical protein [Clostridiales bacterium]